MTASRFWIVLASALALSTACSSAGDVATIPPPSLPTDASDCVYEPGPVELNGTITSISGGIAGLDQRWFTPVGCEQPVQLVNVDLPSLPMTKTSSDCEDCADQMWSSESELVRVTGVVVLDDQRHLGDLGGFVLVSDGRAQAPRQGLYQAHDIDGVSWNLRTRFVRDSGSLFVCAVDFNQESPCAEGTRFEVVDDAALTESLEFHHTFASDWHIVEGSTVDGEFVLATLRPERE